MIEPADPEPKHFFARRGNMFETQYVPDTYETMDLLEALTVEYQWLSAVEFASGEHGLLAAMNSEKSEVAELAATQMRSSGSKLNKFVVKDTRFPGNSPLLIRGDGSIASSFYPGFSGVLLLRRALQTSSPKAAIEWLQKVLATNAPTGVSIHALWGCPVDSEIQLTPTIKIVPLKELPDSFQKQLLTEYSPSLSKSPIVTTLNTLPPSSALVAPCRIEPFLVAPDDALNLCNDQFSATNKLLLDVTLSLTVVGPSRLLKFDRFRGARTQ